MSVTAATGFVVNTGALTVITTSLPGASQFSPYSEPLEASGGDGTYAWTQTGGQLPPGMSLTPQGNLIGTPSVGGAFSFEAKVSSGGGTASASLSISVTPADLPLTIVDQDLPTAEFSRAYAANLIAVGGKPPYVWRVKIDSRLPVGLALSTEGQLEGRASESGEFPFSVEMTDGAGTKVSKDLRIRVVTPSSMHIGTSRLATGFLKKEYLQNLVAVGGKAPYDWSVVKFQQLAEHLSSTDQPGKAVTAIPPEFGIKVEEDPSGQDMLRGTPTRAGLFAITLRVQDSAGNEDITTLPISITYDEALAITTTSLPDAFVGHPYSAKLSHNGGTALVDPQFSVPCVKQVQNNLEDFSCTLVDPTQGIPGGLFLGADGQISGQATPPVGSVNDRSGNLQPMVFSFLVKVTDGSGRSDVRGLSIKVRGNYDLEKTGCSGTAMAPSLAALLVAAGLGLRMRRRR